MAGKDTAARVAALLSLAWPLILSRSAQAVIGFCDALMIAPLGEDALAAVTTGSLNTFSLLILPMGVAFIIQSFSAQLSGKGDLVGARRYGWYGLILAALAGVLGLVCLPFVGPTLGLMPYTAQVTGLMGEYVELRLLAVMAAVGFEAIGSWYGGLGNTRVQMIGSLVMMVLNVALNYVLIEGRLGFPALGVEGAAIASVSATWIAFLVLVALFVSHRGIPSSIPSPSPSPRIGIGIGRLDLRPSEFIRMLRFGLPSGLNWFLEFSAFLLFVDVIVAEVGTTTVAALMVVFQVNSVAYMPAFGLASSGAIMAGQALGAAKPDRVPGIVRLTIATAIIWQGSLGLIYILWPEAIMVWFAAPGANASRLVEVGAPLLALSAAWQLFDAIGLTLSESLRAAGDTAWPMWARLILAWVVFLPAAYVSVIVWDGGGIAAISCMIVYLGLLASVLILRFRGGAWRTIELT